MDSFKFLIETHLKVDTLEKEIRKTRVKLIQAYKNKDFSELYTLHTSYTGFAAHLTKETATFDTLLNDLDIFYFINNNYNNTNKYSELIDNINDSSSNSSISEEQQEITTFYSGNNDNSPVVTDKDTSIISFETQSKQTEHQETELDLYINSFPVSDNYVLEPQMTMEQRNENTNINDINYNNYNTHNNYNNYNNYPANYICHRCGVPGHWIKNCPTNGNPTFDNKPHLKVMKNVDGSTWSSETSKIRSGYEYCGKGFDVFPCYRNECQPIYSSTLLFCNETCNKNENEPESVVVNNHNNNIDNINDNNSVITFKSY